MLKKSPWRRLAPFLLLGCCAAAAACTGLSAARTAAERATYDAVAPLLRRYLERDLSLDDAARATHVRMLDSWRQRLDAEADAEGVPLPPSPGGGR